jgi:hypothetical protein
MFDRVIFDVVVPLTLGHIAKSKGFTIFILFRILKAPERIGVETTGRIKLLNRLGWEDTNWALHQDLGIGKVLTVALLSSPIPVRHAPNISGLIPQWEFRVFIELVFFDPMIDNVGHVIPNTLLHMSAADIDHFNSSWDTNLKQCHVWTMPSWKVQTVVVAIATVRLISLLWVLWILLWRRGVIPSAFGIAMLYNH